MKEVASLTSRIGGPPGNLQRKHPTQAAKQDFLRCHFIGRL